MAYWMLKSEPHAYSWQQLMADGKTNWDGVRNHQATNNLRAMQVGDQGFFYHSNQGLAIVGVVDIIGTAIPDPSDASGRFVMVIVAPQRPLANPVTLAMLKTEPALSALAMLRQPRLSVSPITSAEWQIIEQLAKG
ncbi:MAG: EVE domain-containing protein [Alphaproteobacteria bacterium]|nr:EVE domain-containing protein [Alphaproteobacteria bacterium]